MTYTSIRTEGNGATSSVVRCASLAQLRAWAACNGHAVVKGYAVTQALRSGACVRMLDCNGRVSF